MKRTERFVSILCLIASLIVLPCIFVAHPVLAGVVDGTITAYGWIAEEEYSGLSKGSGSIAIPSGNITQIKSDDSVYFMSGGDFVEETWYTVDYNDSNNSSLYTVDCDTGDYTLIGSTGVRLTGFTYDLMSQTAYVSAYDSTSKLYTIDLATAQVTLVGEITPGCIIGIAADGAGNLYGLDIVDDELYSIDKTTGNGTAIGSIGLNLNYAQDIAFDRNNNILYGALYVWGGSGGLYQIDVETGAATHLADFGAEIDALAIPYTVTRHSVVVSADPSSGGTVTGGDDYTGGALVTVSAAAAEGYKFVNWTENGIAVSTEQDYTFIVAQDRNLVANFTLLAVPVNGIGLNPTALSLTAGSDPFQLTATVTPEDATNKEIRWSSSDESVATVNSAGLVSAVGAGRAVITVTTEDGNFTAECTVTVTEESKKEEPSGPDPGNELPRTGAYADYFSGLGVIITAGGLFFLRRKR